MIGVKKISKRALKRKEMGAYPDIGHKPRRDYSYI
jgi:hypothetical protein